MEKKEGYTKWEVRVLIACLVIAVVSGAAVLYVGSTEDKYSTETVQLINCIKAESSLGDSIYKYRPDCREILENTPTSVYKIEEAEISPDGQINGWVRKIK